MCQMLALEDNSLPPSINNLLLAGWLFFTNRTRYMSLEKIGACLVNNIASILSVKKQGSLCIICI